MFEQLKEVYEILPNYIANFVSILKNPKTYLIKYGQQEEPFKDAAYFFLISTVISSWIVPRFFSESLASTLQVKGLLISFFPAVLGSFAIYFSWKIVRRPIEFTRILKVHLFITGFLGLIGMFFVSFSIGFLILDNPELAEAFYKGTIKATLTHSEKEIILTNQILLYGFSLWSVVGHNMLGVLGGIIAITYSILTWNIFKELANANLIRAGISYLLAMIFSFLLFILFIPFLMSVGENRFSIILQQYKL